MVELEKQAGRGGARLTSSLLGIEIDLAALSVILNESQNAIQAQGPQICFACANPHSLMEAQTDTVFRDALLDADVVVADGVGVTMMARLVRVPIGSRITGGDFYHGLMRRLESGRQGRVFFFGSSGRVLERIRLHVGRDFPSVEVCGAYSPPFGEWDEAEDERMVEMINAAKPDVLWVGMTAPKQEKWVFHNRARLSVPVIASVGAVFDFIAETHPRAPEWVRGLGLEWFYRFLREPRRMWRRNFISTPAFILAVLRRHGPTRLRNGPAS